MSQPTGKKDRLRLFFSRLRGHFETQTAMDGVGTAQKSWQQNPTRSYPTQDVLSAADHFRKTQDPRHEILDYHAAVMDGLQNQDPHFQHANSADSFRLASNRVPLPDGSLLHVHSLGHSSLPGVHAVTLSWTPRGSNQSYFSHWNPDDARGLADRFGEAHYPTGEAIHAALDRGEDAADGEQKFNFSRVTESDFHQSLAGNPAEKTTALAYADWLEENGKPHQASIVREHVNTWGSGAGFAYQGADPGSHSPEVEVQPAGNGTSGIWLTKKLPLAPHPDNPQQMVTPVLFWNSKNMNPVEALEKANRLTSESPVKVNEASYYKGLQAAKNSRQEKPVKMGSYKAPAGGMIVDNLFYQGGSLVPDLQKEQFAADYKPKKKKNKLRTALGKLKKQKNPTWVQTGNQTTEEEVE